jgi:hypothetical protein
LLTLNMIFLLIFLVLTQLQVLLFGKKSCGQLDLPRWAINGNLGMEIKFSFGKMFGLGVGLGPLHYC